MGSLVVWLIFVMWFAYANPDLTYQDKGPHCGHVGENLYCVPYNDDNDNMWDVSQGYVTYYKAYSWACWVYVITGVLHVFIMDYEGCRMMKVSLIVSISLNGILLVWGIFRRLNTAGKVAAGDYITEYDDESLYMKKSGTFLTINILWMIILIVVAIIEYKKKVARDLATRLAKEKAEAEKIAALAKEEADY